MDTESPESPLEAAIRIAGGQRALADAISEHLGRRFTQQAVSYWLRNGTKIEAEYWPAFEAITNRRITRRDLRPDIFPISDVA